MSSGGQGWEVGPEEVALGPALDVHRARCAALQAGNDAAAGDPGGQLDELGNPGWPTASAEPSAILDRYGRRTAAARRRARVRCFGRESVRGSQRYRSWVGDPQGEDGRGQSQQKGQRQRRSGAE